MKRRSFFTLMLGTLLFWRKKPEPKFKPIRGLHGDHWPQNRWENIPGDFEAAEQKIYEELKQMTIRTMDEFYLQHRKPIA